MSEQIETVAALVAKCGIAMVLACFGVGAFLALVYCTYKTVEQVVSDWKSRNRK